MKKIIYIKPGTYNILITAIDDSANVTIKELPTLLNFDFSNLTSIKENLFKSSDNEYLILTINLHTYQEDDQEEKFDKLVEIIGKISDHYGVITKVRYID